MNKFWIDYSKIQSVSFYKDILIIHADEVEYNWNIRNISNKLLNALEADRNNFIISPSGYGIHWPTLDEDLSLNSQ